MSKHASISPTEAADRLAIRELVEAYAHCADRRDAKGQIALFTEDTHFVVYMNAQESDTHPGTALARGVRWTPLFGQKNGSIKVEPLPAILVRFSPKFLGLEDPLSWADLAACSAPTGEAEAGNAGEQPVKE